jgi:hypothetical protein
MTDLPEPPTDLTALMSIDPLDLTKQDLDKIIAYQRKQRLAREGGAKTKRAASEGPAVDIKALLGKIQKGPGPVIVKAIPQRALDNIVMSQRTQIEGAPKAEPTPPKGFIRRL